MSSPQQQGAWSPSLQPAPHHVSERPARRVLGVALRKDRGACLCRRRPRRAPGPLVPWGLQPSPSCPDLLRPGSGSPRFEQERPPGRQVLHLIPGSPLPELPACSSHAAPVLPRATPLAGPRQPCSPSASCRLPGASRVAPLLHTVDPSHAHATLHALSRPSRLSAENPRVTCPPQSPLGLPSTVDAAGASCRTRGWSSGTAEPTTPQTATGRA